jgi:hypothetical protein
MIRSENGRRRSLKKLLKIAVVVVVLLSASVLLAYNYTCPCAVLPGRALSGELNTNPVASRQNIWDQFALNPKGDF